MKYMGWCLSFWTSVALIASSDTNKYNNKMLVDFGFSITDVVDTAALMALKASSHLLSHLKLSAFWNNLTIG